MSAAVIGWPSSAPRARSTQACAVHGVLNEEQRAALRAADPLLKASS